MAYDRCTASCGSLRRIICTSHSRQDTVSDVAMRTPTSIFLLSALLVGILGTTGMCALMCERHRGTESHIHCGQQHHQAMRGMTHDHSAMNHPPIHPERPVMASQSCPSNCDRAERLNLSRKIVPQVTAAQTGAVALDTWATFLEPNTATTWSSGLGHAPPTASSASFSILRI